VSVERNLIISLLKLTKEEPVLIKNVKLDAHLPFDVTLNMLEKLQCEGLVNLANDFVEVNGANRLQLAVKAASLGAVIEHISDLLCWQEFEDMAVLALKNNGFSVSKNVRFNHGGRKWEIDAVGCKKPLVICIDCKHWQRAMAPSVLGKVADAQADRAKALCEALPNAKLQLECTRWSRANFVPAILSLIPCRFKFYDNVPIVPVLQLQDFLNQLPAYTYSLKSYSKTFDHLSENL
jgi:Holliday junction resolvase-like predicted endonuclease